MVGVVSSIPTGGNFILILILKRIDVNFAQKSQKCQICVIYKKKSFSFTQKIIKLVHALVWMSQILQSSRERETFPSHACVTWENNRRLIAKMEIILSVNFVRSHYLD